MNCHDPHGDSSNGALVATDLRRGGAFTVSAGTGIVIPTAFDNVTFTDRATGATTAGTSYSDIDAPHTSVCETCHTKTGTGVGATAPTPGFRTGRHGLLRGAPGRRGRQPRRLQRLPQARQRVQTLGL